MRLCKDLKPMMVVCFCPVGDKLFPPKCAQKKKRGAHSIDRFCYDLGSTTLEFLKLLSSLIIYCHPRLYSNVQNVAG